MRRSPVVFVAGMLALAACSNAPTTPTAHEADASSQAASTATADPTDSDTAALADQLAQAREGTGRYVTDLELAKSDGYQVITPMMPDMGVHYLNPLITDFDPAKPAILVYVPTESGPQLGALEWVFPELPAEAPFPGAEYGEFAAACHYVDGTFTLAEAESDCAPSSDAGSAFNFWHPLLRTLHVWLWFDNPDGLFTGMNPLVTPFNGRSLAMNLDYGV